jgi:glycosyltransferase involved in cell wall biosynthesis
MDRGSQEARQPGEPGITVLRAYTYPAIHRSFFHRVISFLSFMLTSFFTALTVRNVDLVWGTSPPIFQAGTSWLLAVVRRAPFVFEVRDLWPAFAVEVGVLHQRVLIRAAEAFERFLYRRADLVIVNSPGFIDHVTRRGARRVEVVPNGSDTTMFEHAGVGNKFRQENNLEGKYILLYAGAHGLSNDLGIVLEAAAKLGDMPDVSFVLVGDGKEKPGLEARARAMGLNNVIFLPPVPKMKMPDVLAAADACLAILKPIPIYGTVYPNKVFDYMAAGRPVILAMTGVIRAVVESAQAGIPIDPGDPLALANAVRFLAAHPEDARKMGMNGRRCVQEQYDRQVIGEKFARILEKLLESIKV